MFPWTSLRSMKEFHIHLIRDENIKNDEMCTGKSSVGQIHSLVRPELRLEPKYELVIG